MQAGAKVWHDKERRNPTLLVLRQWYNVTRNSDDLLVKLGYRPGGAQRITIPFGLLISDVSLIQSRHRVLLGTIFNAVEKIRWVKQCSQVLFGHQLSPFDFPVLRSRAGGKCNKAECRNND